MQKVITVFSIACENYIAFTFKSKETTQKQSHNFVYIKSPSCKTGSFKCRL